jgi:hypothetical protein
MSVFLENGEKETYLIYRTSSEKRQTEISGNVHLPVALNQTEIQGLAAEISVLTDNHC